MAVQARVSRVVTCVCKVFCVHVTSRALRSLMESVLYGVQASPSASPAGLAPARSEISKKIIALIECLRTVPKRIGLQPNRTQTIHDIITDQPVARRLYYRAR